MIIKTYNRQKHVKHIRTNVQSVDRTGLGKYTILYTDGKTEKLTDIKDIDIAQDAPAGNDKTDEKTK